MLRHAAPRRATPRRVTPHHAAPRRATLRRRRAALSRRPIRSAPLRPSSTACTASPRQVGRAPRGSTRALSSAGRGVYSRPRATATSASKGTARAPSVAAGAAGATARSWPQHPGAGSPRGHPLLWKLARLLRAAPWSREECPHRSDAEAWLQRQRRSSASPCLPCLPSDADSTAAHRVGATARGGTTRRWGGRRLPSEAAVRLAPPGGCRSVASASTRRPRP